MSSYKLALLKKRVSSGRLISSFFLLAQFVRNRFWYQKMLVFRISRSELENMQTQNEDSILSGKVESCDKIDDNLRMTLEAHDSNEIRKLEDVLNDGAVLWVVRIDNEVVNYTVARSGDKVEGYFFPLGSDDILISHGYTLPEYRGRGSCSRCIRRVLNSTPSNFKNFYVDCSDWNIASIRTIEKAGFKYIGYGTAKKSKQSSWHAESKTRKQYAN